MYGGGQDTGLETLVYLSKAVREISPVGLHGLLSKARENNRACDLTGALLYGDGVIIQVLEGPAGRIDQTLAKIEADPRHHDIRVLLRDTIDERSFAGCSLGYRNAEADAARVFALIQDRPCIGENDQLGRAILRSLKQLYAASHPHVTA